MNYIKTFLCYFLLAGCLLNASEQNEETFQVVNRTFSDVKWKTHSDGSDPEMINWKMKIELNDGHELEAESNDSERVDPRRYMRIGDSLKILEEFFLYDNPNHSWFKIINLDAGESLLMKGKARKPKPSFNDPENQVLINDLKIESKKDLHQLSFSTILGHFKVAIPDRVLVNYYEGMPIDILKREVVESDQWGRYRLQIIFSNPLSQEEVQATSEWLGGDVLSMEVTKYENHFSFRKIQKGGDAWGEFLSKWIMEMTLDDGSTFYRTRLYSGREYFKACYRAIVPTVCVSGDGGTLYTKLFVKSDDVEIMAEWSGDTEMRKNNQSYFLLHNKTQGKKYVVTGKTRFPEGFGQKPEK